MEDDAFHCENCNGELVVECNKLTSEEVADGDDNARRRRREKLRDMLQKMEVFVYCFIFSLQYSRKFVNQKLITLRHSIFIIH